MRPLRWLWRLTKCLALFATVGTLAGLLALTLPPRSLAALVGGLVGGIVGARYYYATRD